jgi:amino-acid N-acetyltransferase
MALIRLSDQWGGAGQASGVAEPVPSRRPAREPSWVPDTTKITVRPARIADMRDVEPLIRTFANDNLMLPKGLDQLNRSFREFVVAVDEDDFVIGCAALRIYTEDLAEVCSLAVDPAWQRAGVGRKLVERIVEEAQALGLTEVFALTLRPEFFEKLGFGIVVKENFPLKVWADCRNCPKLHACDEIAVSRKV